TLLDNVSLEDTQQASSQSAVTGSRLVWGSKDNRSNASSRLGWGSKESKVMVESVEAWDSTLSAYALPNMDPLPASDFPPIKGVTCFCHDISMEGKTEHDGSVRFCAMKKRMMHIFSIRDKWVEEAAWDVGARAWDVAMAKLPKGYWYLCRRVELPYVVALLRNNHIEVHNIMDQKLVQSFQLATKSRTISTGPGIKVDAILDNATLDANHVDKALELADQAISTATPENVYGERMASFNHFFGFIYLGETLFDLALPLFEKGKIDPRVLIRFFSEMRDVLDENEPVNIYSGVKEVADRLGSIEDIVSGTMIKNYDPHIKPDIETAPATQKLSKILITNAKEMLQKFLTWDREQRKSSGKVLTKEDKAILKAVDNALVRLYSETNSVDLLRNLLEGDNQCDLDLCKKILEDHKEYRKALEIWKSLIDQKNSNQDFPDGLQKMADFLAKSSDQEFFWEHASWVIHRDEIIGAKIFTRQDSKKHLHIDPNVVIKELRSVGKSGLKVYLEYLITSRKSQEEEHHTEYALLCIKGLQAELLREEVQSKFEVLTDSFVKRKGTRQTYLSFLNGQPTDDTLSQARTKLMTFMQTSTRLNAEEVLTKLKEIEVLKAELAIVFGKLGQHETALRILINDLKDYRGAEIYCLHAGRMIGMINKSTSKKYIDKKISEEKSQFATRRDLFLTLLKVYLEMENRDEIVDIIIHLLNTQAVYMDIMEVLSLLPKYWSVEMLNEFLIRSLRKNYHEYREGQILKGLCRGENTMITHELFQKYKEIGPIIITQNVVCAACKKHISGAGFKRLPNSDIVHVRCGVDDEHGEGSDVAEYEDLIDVDRSLPLGAS
ncbi:17554_t:CDS:10, partial [Acaulospora colombiana]